MVQNKLHPFSLNKVIDKDDLFSFKDDFGSVGKRKDVKSV